MTTRNPMARTPEVSEALEEIQATFPDAAITARDDAEGGVFVLVDEVELGAPHQQATTWLGFHVTFQYPYSDVYPIFVRGDLQRIDLGALGEALTPGSFEARTAIQVSRRANHLNPATDTAAIKLLKVLCWLRSHDD